MRVSFGGNPFADLQVIQGSKNPDQFYALLTERGGVSYGIPVTPFTPNVQGSALLVAGKDSQMGPDKDVFFRLSK